MFHLVMIKILLVKVFRIVYFYKFLDNDKLNNKNINDKYNMNNELFTNVSININTSNKQNKCIKFKY